MPHDTICAPLPDSAKAVKCFAGIVLFEPHFTSLQQELVHSQLPCWEMLPSAKEH